MNTIPLHKVAFYTHQMYVCHYSTIIISTILITLFCLMLLTIVLIFFRAWCTSEHLTIHKHHLMFKFWFCICLIPIIAFAQVNLNQTHQELGANKDIYFCEEQGMKPQEVLNKPQKIQYF